MRRLLLTACFLGAALLPSMAGAETRVTRGMRAPPIDARAIGDDTPVPLAAYRGRMLLLQLFGTDCPHCKREVPRMNAIAESYAPRGIDVLALTPDDAPAIRRFAREQKVRYAIARIDTDVLRRYGVKRYPHGVLVGPDGRVLWQGRPDRMTDRVLDAYLGRVRIAPSAPATFAKVEADRRAGRYGAVEAALDRLRACRRIDRATCRYVLDTLAWVDWHREAALAAARSDEERGRFASALRTYEELAVAYAGTPTAREAETRRKAILADPQRARQVAGMQALRDARRAGRWKPPATKRTLLEAVVRMHAGTRGASEAKALLGD